MNDDNAGPLGTLPAPTDAEEDVPIEEKIDEYIQKQKEKKSKKKKKEEAEKEEEPAEDPEQLSRNVEYFYPKDPTAGQLFVLVGKSERGKTHFLRWLLYSMCLRPKGAFQFGLVMVRTKFKHSYRFHWASEQHVRVYEGFNKDVLVQYVENLKKRYQQQGYLEPSFLVFDDLVGILNTQDGWMSNFIGTYRHYNISIFVAVQYLTGRQSVSPIMREQTSFTVMFLSKNHKTLNALWENYGQMMDKKSFFRHLANATDPEATGTKHACVVYSERVDKLEHNYMSWLAPASLPDGEVMLKGPDKPKEPSKDELMKEQRLAQLAWRAPSWVPKNLNLSREDHAALQKMMHYADAAKSRLRKGKSMAQKDKQKLREMVAFGKDAEAAAEARWREQQVPPPRPPRYGYVYANNPNHRWHPYRTPSMVRRIARRPVLGLQPPGRPGGPRGQRLLARL